MLDFLFNCFTCPIMFTNSLMIPSILKSFCVGHYATCALGSCAVITSYMYHTSKETKYHSLDVFFARINVLWFFKWYFLKSSLLCRLSLLTSLICYLLAKTGGPKKRNPTYVFWHSIFHVFISLTSFTAI